MVVNLLVFTIASCYVIFKYLYDEQSYSLWAIIGGPMFQSMRYIYEVYKEMSFSRAAQKLFIRMA